jgi:FkbM family methyltransferase
MRVYRRGVWLAKRVFWAAQAIRTFENYPAFFSALRRKSPGQTTLLTRKGLRILIRNNRWDARIIRETFLERPYIKFVRLRSDPIIVDIGAYIGDFSLYAAKYLNARVIAYEPTPENFALLEENIELNDLQDQINAVNLAVGPSGELVLNITKDEQEIHVSAYWYGNGEQRTVRSISLEDLFKSHGLQCIDLLKVDCEGGEYDIFADTPGHLFSRIPNIVFEWHRVDGYEEKLTRVKERLTTLGYDLKQRDLIIYAMRH